MSEQFEVNLRLDEDGDPEIVFDRPMQRIAFTPDQLFKFATHLGTFAMRVRDKKGLAPFPDFAMDIIKKVTEGAKH